MTEFANGDRVYAVNWGARCHGNTEHPIGGAFAEFIAIPAHKLSRIPENVSYSQAAAIALVGTTALQALNLVNVKNGDKVLILGGSSAVGMIAIQLAKLKGAFVATTASSRSLEFTQQFGADALINYNEKKWWLENETGLSEFDVIFDTVGESEVFPHSITPGLIKLGGKFISIANDGAGPNPTAHEPALSYASRFFLSNERKVQDELIQLINEGNLVVPIESSFSFDNDGILKMFEKIRSKKSQGKNVLNIL